MNRPLLASVGLALCALPLFAQDPAPKTAAPAQGPVLVIETSRMEVAAGLARLFDHQGDVPELADGHHFVLSLGADRALKVGTAAGDAGFLQATANPGALLDLFREQVESARPMVRGTMTLALQPQGWAPKDVAALVDAIFDFPRQLSGATLKITGDPDNVHEEGLDIVLAVEPKADTASARLVGVLAPCSQGVPVMAGERDAALAMHCSLSPDSLKALFAPFLPTIVAMTYQDPELRKQATGVMDRSLLLYDGSFAVVLGPKFTGSMLIGLLDGPGMQQMLASEEYQAMMKSQQMASRDLTIEVTPVAFEHRGARVMKSRVTSDGPPNPLMPDGTMETCLAVTGNWFAGTIGGKDDDCKAVIDLCADQKVKRAPLAEGELMRIGVDIAAMVGAVQGGGGRGLPPDAPTRATVSFGKQGSGLRLSLHLQ